MSFQVFALSAEPFAHLFGLSDEDLALHGVVRRTVDRKPGYPCRITLEDAEPGSTVLLLHHTSHEVATPFRSSYAVYVGEGAVTVTPAIGEVPGALRGRPLALRQFDRDGWLRGARLVLDGDVAGGVEAALADPEVAYIHAHNAAHGCYAARIARA